MTVQGQVSLLQFIKSDNHKINYDRDESSDILSGLSDNPIVPVQSHLKAMRQLIMVGVK